ncbi:MAG: ABC transporter ATP-binding protein [Geminicoccaceae bacterium]
MSPTLAIRELTVRLGAVRVLHRIRLEIAPGEVHGLVGESGAGKSMIARAVLGLLPAAARVEGGSIRFEGRELNGMAPAEHRQLMGREISLVPQDPMTALNPGHTIGAQLGGFLRRRGGLGRAAAGRRALELLERVRIREASRVLGLYPHELSGGMRQRVLIAMAFALQPRLVVADEPTTALDVTVQREILRLFRELQHDHGCAVLFVTHDLGVVAKLCDRVSVIFAGTIWEQETTALLLERPLHPYTRALLAAMPRWDRPGDTLVPVPAELTRQLRLDAEAYDAA